jgi:hypothetical protein
MVDAIRPLGQVQISPGQGVYIAADDIRLLESDLEAIKKQNASRLPRLLEKALGKAVAIFNRSYVESERIQVRGIVVEIIQYCEKKKVEIPPYRGLLDVLGVFKGKRVSKVQKLLNAIFDGNISHIQDGANNEVGLNGSRTEYANAEISFGPNYPGLSGAERKDVLFAPFGESAPRELGTIFQSIADKPLAIAFEIASPETGFSPEIFLNRRNVVAMTSAGYQEEWGTKEVHMGLTARNGSVSNYYLSPNMDGLAIIKGGKLEIVSLAGKKYTEVVADIVKNRASAFQSHLLLLDGNLTISLDKSNPNRGPRRLLLTFDDGRVGLIHFKEAVTLYEAAVLASKIPGIKSALNMDTGSSNMAFISDGKKLEQIGTYPGREISFLVFSRK